MKVSNTIVSICKTVIPEPVRALRRRYHLVKTPPIHGGSRLVSACRLLNWTAHELLNIDIGFRTQDRSRYVGQTRNRSSYLAYFQGEKDPEIQAFIRRNLGPGKVFVDVGANIGTYTVPAAKLVGDAGKVVAIEPHPAIFRLLEKNISLNRLQNVLPVRTAIGETNGNICIAFDRCNAGQTHVTGEADLTSNGESVPIARLDDLLIERGITEIDYLKIDVEGYEKFVLAGAQRIIAKSAAMIIQMELIHSHVARYGISCLEIAEILRTQYFVPYQLDKNGWACQLTEADLARDGEVFWSRKPIT